MCNTKSWGGSHNHSVWWTSKPKTSAPNVCWVSPYRWSRVTKKIAPIRFLAKTKANHTQILHVNCSVCIHGELFMIVSNKLEYNTAVAERRRLFQQALPLYVKCDIIYARILFVVFTCPSFSYWVALIFSAEVVSYNFLKSNDWQIFEDANKQD